ncbi:MAG TPA: TolC family protein [Polyangiales bacterium]|nr:TolC family protein [Polyangiales bacterium]
MNARSVCFGFGIALATLPLRAAGQSDGAVVLSLEEAQSRAARLAPEARLAAGRIKEAAATRVGAGVILPVNPSVSFDARPGLDRNTRGEVGVAGGLDVTFEVGGGPGAREREADARTRSATAEGGIAQLEARLAAEQAYVAERIAALRIAHAKEAIELGERVLAAALERLNAGAGSDIDVSSAKSELAEFRAELHAAEAERRQSEMELRYLVAIPVAAPLQLSTAIEQPIAIAPIESLVKRSREQLPDLAAIRARLGLLAAADNRLKTEAFPKLGARLGVDASPASPVYGIAGLSVELPFAQRNQGPRAVVAAERETELDRFDFTAGRLDLALRAIHGAYEAHREELGVLTQAGLPAAEEHLRLVETGWRAGRFDIFRLTTAAQSLVRMKAARVSVLERIWRQRMLLERWTGGSIDDRS